MIRLFPFLLAAAALAQPPKRILLITDAEGVAGVCRQDQTDPTNVEMRALLTGEINAAVRGFYDGGADEVVVWDGHDGSQTLSALTIHPRAKLLQGSLGWNGTLDRGYSAIGFLGQHSMGNVRKGIMAHSFSSLGIQNMKLNGKPVGEIDVWAGMAGAFNTPVILLTGDQAAVDELKAIVPDAEFAAVKEGLARYACLSLSAESARSVIHDAAMRSVAKIGKIRPYRIEGPVTLEIEYTTRNSLNPDLSALPWVEVLDDRTIRYKGSNLMEAWKRYRVR
ncbi:MAG: M55 family metallopeptidase [Bryobacteraceae bacterium]